MPIPSTPVDLGLGPMPFHATPMRPLLGLTVLVVEDSRFASEAMRLLCIRSGARIRRADSLKAADRHLRVYRPNVVIVDLGLPDGSGLELISVLGTPKDAQDRPIIIATSGADGEGMAEAAIAAGADRFLAKPVNGVAEFQQTILDLMPEGMRPTGPRLLSEETIRPDSLALAEDLMHLDDLLEEGTETLGYVVPFLQGLSRLTGDRELRAAANQLVEAQNAAAGTTSAIRRVRQVIKSRVAVVDPV